MIMALAGSCWSSCCSTRNSRDRCSARARDSLSLVALEVVNPHAVPVLIPALTDSDSLVPREPLVWAFRDGLPRHGSTPPASLRPRAVLCEVPSVADHDVASELAEP